MTVFELLNFESASLVDFAILGIEAIECDCLADLLCSSDTSI